MFKKSTFLFLLIVLISCHKNSDERAKAEGFVAEWVGKTIHFNKNIPITVYGKDTLIPNFNNTPYRILVYVDSTGCTNCKLKLYEWQKLIAETDTLMSDKLSFMFYFQPKNSNELKEIIQRDRFTYPVFIDYESVMLKTNKFPKNPLYQCFLIDSHNKVILIGNPTKSHKVWNLYKQIVTGKIQTENSTITEVDVIDKEIQLKGVKTNVKQKMVFRLKNIGNNPLVIADVKTSCGCTNAIWDKQPIALGKITDIKAEIVLEHAGYFGKTLTVYCNAKNNPITLTIKGKTE